MKSVVLASQKLDGEASHATLTRVEGIPDMVHHGVNGVVKASFLVQNENGLDCSIPSIPVEIFKLE